MVQYLSILVRWSISWVFVSSCLALAQSPTPSPELWYGVLETPKQHLRMLFSLSPPGSGDQGTLTVLDQKESRHELTGVQRDAKNFRLEAGSLQGEFTATQMESARATGVWKQGGAELPLVLEQVKAIPQDKPSEVWEGELNAITVKLQLRLRMYDMTQEGTRTSCRLAYLDSLTEQQTSIVAQYQQINNDVIVDIPALNATYRATLNDLSNEMKGSFKQGPLPLPLTLTRKTPAANKPRAEVNLPAASPIKEQTNSTKVVANPIEATQNRGKAMKTEKSEAKNDKSTVPQDQLSELRNDPQQPFQTREFRVSHPDSGGTSLAGTMTIPRGNNPAWPAVIMITGSGPQDRDETILQHKPFAVLAKDLAQRGIASFRFDDRGIGESTGDFFTATTDDFAKDAQAVLALAQSMQGIDPKRIGLLGHSEGAMVAAIVASWYPDVAAVVMLGAPGVRGHRILEQQSDRMAELTGESAENRESALAMRKKIHALAMDPSNSQANYAKQIREVVAQYLTPVTKDPKMVEDVGSAFEVLWTPWFQRFLQYDPAPTMMLVRCPVLGLWGELDVQVIPEPNLSALIEALERSGNRDVEFGIMPQLNHLFQSAKTGLPDEYGKIKTTIDPSALEYIGEWLQRKL